MRDTSAAGRASSLEHDPADALRKPSRAQSQWLKRLAGSARPPLLLAGAAPLAGGVLLVIQAWLLASVLDAAIARQAPRSDLLGGILGIAALMLVRACIAWAGERAGAIAAERIKRQVRLALFERLVDKGPHWSRGQASACWPAPWWTRSRRWMASSPNTCRPWPPPPCCRWHFPCCCFRWM